MTPDVTVLLAASRQDHPHHAPGVSMVSLGVEWTHFMVLCVRLDLTGNAIPEAWIAAAQHHPLHLVTFDKGFRKLLKPSMVTVLKG